VRAAGNIRRAVGRQIPLIITLQVKREALREQDFRGKRGDLEGLPYLCRRLVLPARHREIFRIRKVNRGVVCIQGQGAGKFFTRVGFITGCSAVAFAVRFSERDEMAARQEIETRLGRRLTPVGAPAMP
jgi:hypothetical protein